MTNEDKVFIACVLADVEEQISTMLKHLDSAFIEHLNEEGVWLESWRDDIRTAIKRTGVNL